MQRRKIRILILILFLNLPACLIHMLAQAGPDVSSLSAAMKKEAYSVIRNYSAVFSCLSQKDGIYKETVVITVLSAEGKEMANFNCYGDDFRELKSFSGELYNENGSLLRKIKRSDLKYSEFSSGLASDDKYYFYECSSPSYPYTVKYEYEVKYKQGIIGFPVFAPQKGFNQSVEKASYCLELPAGMDFKTKSFGVPDAPEKQTVKNKTAYTWRISGIAAIERELFGPSLRSLLPHMYLKPVRFVYGGYAGDQSDWNSFGKWQCELLRDRDVLPDAVKQEIIRLTGAARSEKEKIRILYDYLAETTRYVSIQLGIGGLQPIEASVVARDHFGDCKGLSNYMKAMLKALGIPSWYAVISTDNANLMHDFASAQQMNHVILGVPLEEETLWLECTNPQLPFGYVHRRIAGHESLLIKDDGGEIVRLPVYPDSSKREIYRADVTIDDNGNASVKATCESFLDRYENRVGYLRKSPREQVDYLRSGLQLTEATVSNPVWNEHRNTCPSVEVAYDIVSGQYGSRTGSRLFIPVNIFRRGFGNLTAKMRVHDVCVDYGFVDSDTIRIRIPEKYEVEALPYPVTIDTAFGRFTSVVEVKDREILITQHLYVPSGRFAAETYASFVSFCNMVSSAYREKIILRKEEQEGMITKKGG